MENNYYFSGNRLDHLIMKNDFPVGIEPQFDGDSAISARSDVNPEGALTQFHEP